MATAEHINKDPSQVEITETPTQYPVELLRATFDPHDVKVALAYQEGLGSGAVDQLLERTVPPDFAEKYRSTLPLLTYNTSRYGSEIESKLQSDSIIKALLTRTNSHERARAICARRSLMVLDPSKEEK